MLVKAEVVKKADELNRMAAKLLPLPEGLDAGGTAFIQVALHCVPRVQGRADRQETGA